MQQTSKPAQDSDGMPAWFAAVGRIRSANTPIVRRILLVLAVVFLGVGLALALREHPGLLHDLHWMPVALLLLVAIPVTLLLNAVEFALISRLVRQNVTYLQAVEISILGTVANMLPLPGGAVVRVVALKANGASYGKGTTATLLAALIWMGVSFVYAGSWIAASSAWGVGTVLVSGGAAILAVAAFITVRLQVGLGVSFNILILRLGMVLLDALRLYLCLRALGVVAEFSQASAFAAASAAGSSISIVPSGLGIREGVTAALAPLVGLTAASGFLAAALNRLLEFPILLPAALMLNLRRRSGFMPRSPKSA